MGWEEFWLPLLVRGFVTTLITAIFGTILTFFVRRWLKLHAARVLAMLGITITTVKKSAIDNHFAAEDASATRALTEDVVSRLKSLESANEAWRKAIDDSVGQRARQELRFTQLEERIEDQ